MNSEWSDPMPLKCSGDDARVQSLLTETWVGVSLVKNSTHFSTTTLARSHDMSISDVHVKATEITRRERNVLDVPFFGWIQ